MKFMSLPITAAAAAFLASSCAQAIEDDNNNNALALTLIKNNLQTLTTTAKDNGSIFQPGHSLNLFDISPECEAEIESLTENNNLMTAAESLGQTCPYSQDGNNLKQDFGSCDLGQFQLACTAAGGNFTTVPSIHIICSARGQSVSLDIKDMPDCIGKSCDESVLDSEENRKELANVLEQVLRSEGVSANCRSPAAAIRLSKTALFGGFVFLLVTMFS